MLSDKEIVSTNVRCPKCKSANLYLREIGTWSSQFVVTDGRFDRKEGQHQPESVDRLEAKCRECAHTWKVRGAFQIDHAVAEEKQA
jgi:phage FluMu protein Com